MIDRMFNRLIITINSVVIRAISLLNGSWISLGATLHVHYRGRLLIGKGVRVAKNSVLSILPGGILELKDGSIVGHGVTIFCANRIIVGAECRIAHNCSLVDHDYDINSTASWGNRKKISSPIIIGNNVWLGAHVIMLKGVSVGDRCVIGAQCLVLKSIPRGMVAYSYGKGELKHKEL